MSSPTPHTVLLINTLIWRICHSEQTSHGTLLLPESPLFLGSPFLPNVLFLSRVPPGHCITFSSQVSLGSSWLWCFWGFPCFWWPWGFGVCCSGILYSAPRLMFSSWFDQGNAFWGGKSTKCLSSCILSRVPSMHCMCHCWCSPWSPDLR